MLLNCGVGEDAWESPGLQGGQTSQSKVNQSWTFIRRTDVEAEASVFWPPDVNWPIRENDDAGWERLKAGDRDDRRPDVCYGITDSLYLSLSKLWDMVRDTETLCAATHGVEKVWTGLSDWTTMMLITSQPLVRVIKRNYKM